MNFKSTLFFLHKWLGIIASIFILITAISGCILSFSDDIKDIARKEWRIVKSENRAFIAPSILLQQTQNIVKGSTPSMVTYNGKNRSAVVYTFDGTDSFSIYFNPYSGKHLKTEPANIDFFKFVENLHFNFLLPRKIGRMIVGGFTSLYILIVLLGYCLVFFNKQQRKNINTKSKTVINYKSSIIHKKAGLYLGIPTLIIAITGLFFSYPVLSKNFYRILTNFDNNNFMIKNLEQNNLLMNGKIDKSKMLKPSWASIDKAMLETFRMQNNAQMYYILLPTTKPSLLITGAYPKSLNYDNRSNFYYYPDDAALYKTEIYDEKPISTKIISSIHGIHTGQRFDLAGKAITFLLSLSVAIIATTGIIMFYRK